MKDQYLYPTCQRLDEPLGFGTYVNVESFVASTGKGLNKEFFNFNYDITRFYINSQLQTCVVLKCRNTVSEEVNGLMHIQYCKFRGDVVEFDITLPSSVNREAISLEIPPLKYNKISRTIAMLYTSIYFR